MPKETGTIDLKAQKAARDDAAKYATDYITEISGDGIWVTPEDAKPVDGQATSATTGWHISDALELVKAGVKAFRVWLENGMAKLRIGEADKSHLDLDYHSMQMMDKEGDTYFYVSDLRDSNGYATVEYEITPRTSMDEIEVDLSPIIEVLSVTIDGVEITDYTFNSSYVFLPTATTGTVKVTHTTTSQDAKAYTLGTRASNSTVGAHSYAVGSNVVASYLYSYAEGYRTESTRIASHAEGRWTEAHGHHSHAEGDATTASGNSSHSEGCNTVASGAESHAEGYESEASGWSSHAQNLGTVAASRSQTALGKYNVEDANGTYAVIVGNGTAENARSDAARLDWNGNLQLAGDVKDMSGNGKYLPLSGGTMSGALVNTDNYIYKSTTLDRDGAAPTDADKWVGGFYIRDKDGDDWGCLRAVSRKNGNHDIMLSLFNASGDENRLQMSIDNNGNLGYWISGKAKFRDAIGIGAYGSITGQSSTVTLSTTAAKLPLSTFSGTGCSASANGIKVAAAGTYMVWGSAYYHSGYNANDIVHLLIYKNSSSALDAQKRVYATSPYEVYSVGPVILDLAANDVVYLYAYNQSGARGTVNSRANVGLYVKRIA